MSTSKSGGCGCAACGTGTGTCTEGSFKRPQFFAGQLLTEDDLQAMMDYVVGKNRLHNRYLFGEGVVCGLSVTCHPCGGGHVMVAPGFALDCCGNDILLPCKEELDIAVLLRDLRKRQLEGYQCGDPCDKAGDRRTYGLYLTYRETPVDPVTPYTSGDSCGQQRCEPTRIQEGYAFELRCECGGGRKPDVYARILACIGDLKSAALAIENANALYELAMEIKRGPANGAAAPAPGKIQEMRGYAVLVKAWLLAKLEQSGSLTRCDLYQRVKNVHLDAGQSDPFSEGGDKARDEADAWLDLVRVMLEYFIDCACLALNPPCGPCDDAALLLACVELDGCDVIDVCNMSRTFVLSPAAMRYWLPANLIGNMLKQLCCDLDLSSLFEVEEKRQPPPAPPAAPPDDAGKTTVALSMQKAGPGSAIGANTRIALERVGISAEQAVDAVDFSAGLAGLAMRVGKVETGALRIRANAVTDELFARVRPQAASVAEAPEVREVISDIVKKEVASGREAVVAELRDHVGTRTEDLSKKVATDLDRSVTSAVAKEMTASKLNGAVENLAVMKALRKENAALTAKLDKLQDAVKKLGSGT